MNYDISEVSKEYQGIHIGVLVGQNMDNRRQIPELVILQEEAVENVQKVIGNQPPTKHPHISSWRELYRSFGTKPSDYRPSAEALIRRTLKTGALPRINNAVDLYNIVSVKYLIPMGGFDLDRIDGDIHLRFSAGEEEFIPLGSKGPELTYPGEIVYADDSRVLTRRWNYRDADATKITEETRNLVMFVDGAPEISVKFVQSALIELKMLYERFCGGKYAINIASEDSPIVSLEV